MEEPESGGIDLARCVNHPSQVLTGICSLCLAERLSGVESSGIRGGGSQIEIVEPSPPVTRVRKTLLSLFELDDLNSVHESTITDVGSFGIGAGKDEVLKESGVLDSPFARRGSMWGLRSASKRIRKVEGGVEDREVGRSSKNGSRRSCDWTICRDSGKASWEEPRHSWDGGSMVSRAFICSFACLHEPQDGSPGMRRELPDEATDATGNSELSSADNVVACEKASSSNASIGGILREIQHDEINGQVPVSGIDRKKSNRWTRMLDWSVTSPFRDLAKRRERMLDRSLSESWREGRKDRNVVATELDGRVRFHGNGHVSTSTSHSSNRSMNSVNGDQSNIRLDRQKKKEFRFGRSRSVHYFSPGNLESGLLRFYLTPLRSSSRRSRNIGRGNKSHSFARSIFGLN